MRRMRAGEIITYGDVHDWDHPSVVMRGSVEIEVRTDGGRVGKTIVHAGDGEHCEDSVINVPATWKHNITALEDDTVLWCICPPNQGGSPVLDKSDANLEYEWS